MDSFACECRIRSKGVFVKLAPIKANDMACAIMQARNALRKHVSDNIRWAEVILRGPCSSAQFTVEL